MLPILERIFAPKKQEKPKKDVEKILKEIEEEIIVHLGDTVFWTMDKDNDSRPVPKTLKWAWINKADYQYPEFLGPINKIRGTSPFITGKFTTKTYDPSILELIVKDSEAVKLDLYIPVYIEHGIKLSGYVKNTDNYFRPQSKDVAFHVSPMRRGLPIGAVEIPRTEAHKFLYTYDDEIQIAVSKFSKLFKTGKNRFMIQALDEVLFYDLRTWKEYKRFKADLEYYELPQNKNYYE